MSGVWLLAMFGSDFQERSILHEPPKKFSSSKNLPMNQTNKRSKKHSAFQYFFFDSLLLVKVGFRPANYKIVESKGFVQVKVYRIGNIKGFTKVW